MSVFYNFLLFYYRNGKSLGEAFSCVRLGPGYAYFPAVSLSLGESLRANFGATPLRYPFSLQRVCSLTKLNRMSTGKFTGC